MRRTGLARRRFVLATGAALFHRRGLAASPTPPLAGLAYSPPALILESTTLAVAREELRADLRRLLPLTRHIRTYTVERGMDEVPAIARALGMRVSLGLWLGADATLNAAEVARGLRVIARNGDVIDRVFVGNETLLRRDLSSAALGQHLKHVRAAVAGRGIEVTTGETWTLWRDHPEIAADCDVIGAHLIPYWDGVDVDEAVATVSARYDDLASLFPDKPIVIAETGWPSRGKTREGAVPSLAAQQAFLRAFVKAAGARDYDYYLLEAYDQPWKVAAEGEVGGAWGLFDARGAEKFPLEATFRSAAESKTPEEF